jgi:hypothetical protein
MLTRNQSRSNLKISIHPLIISCPKLSSHWHILRVNVHHSLTVNVDCQTVMDIDSENVTVPVTTELGATDDEDGC